ncbi:MAG: flippase-like domain-containing protein, partial [Paramuribaculum sp.]|nr:flippase-like domain-containing protein [Paramuribaculum sp.]
VVVVMLLLLSLVLAHPVMLKFFSHYKIGTDIDNLVTHRRLWIMLGAALAIISALLYIFRQSKIVKKIDGSVTRIWDGFKVIFHMKGRGLYVVLTFGIWICYYLETYSCFYAFDFTRELITQPGTAWGLIPGLVVFVFGSMSIAVPSNGGLGPWNLAVMFALSLYGIGHNQGMAYSMVAWSCQSIMQLCLGLFAAIYILRTDHKRKKLSTSASESAVSAE